MALESPILSPHNSLWRKLKRGWLYYRMNSFAAFLALVHGGCMIAWMLQDQGWGWLLRLTTVLWLLISIGMLILGLLAAGIALCIYLFARKDGNKKKQLQNLRQPLVWFVWLLPAITIWALILGRIDIAVYINYGSGILSKIFGKQKFRVRNLSGALFSMALLIAFASDLPWMVLLVLPLVIAWQLQDHPFLVTLRKKPTSQAYVAKAREACANGGG